MSNHHLDFYLSIESDLEKCSRYVDFSTGNYATFSIEFSRIIMAAAAEIDTISKELCKLIDPCVSAKNICDYGKCITKKYPCLKDMEMNISRYAIKVKPWDSWSGTSSPSWWKDYNSIKHDRVNNFALATLENAIQAVSALLLLTLYYWKEKLGGQLEVNALSGPKLIGVVNNSSSDDWEEGGIFWSYSLL